MLLLRFSVPSWQAGVNGGEKWGLQKEKQTNTQVERWKDGMKVSLWNKSRKCEQAGEFRLQPMGQKAVKRRVRRTGWRRIGDIVVILIFVSVVPIPKSTY